MAVEGSMSAASAMASMYPAKSSIWSFYPYNSFFSFHNVIIYDILHALQGIRVMEQFHVDEFHVDDTHLRLGAKPVGAVLGEEL